MKLFLNVELSLFKTYEMALAAFGPPATLYLLALKDDPQLNLITQPRASVLLTVLRDGTLNQPVTVSKEDICVLNGGTPPQQWAMARISALGTLCQVVNLQEEGHTGMAGDQRVTDGRLLVVEPPPGHPESQASRWHYEEKIQALRALWEQPMQ